MNSLTPENSISCCNSPGKNTGVGCHSLLQGIFPTQGLNQGVLHHMQILYHLSHRGSPTIVCIWPQIVCLPSQVSIYTYTGRNCASFNLITFVTLPGHVFITIYWYNLWGTRAQWYGSPHLPEMCDAFFWWLSKSLVMVSLTSDLQEDIRDWIMATKKPLTNEMLKELENTFIKSVGDNSIQREPTHYKLLKSSGQRVTYAYTAHLCNYMCISYAYMLLCIFFILKMINSVPSDWK